MQAAAADGPSMEGGVVGCHRAVPDRHLPIALQLTLNSAEGLAMLQVQMECGRTDELLILLDLDLPDDVAEKFLVELRRNEQFVESAVAGYTSDLPPFGEDVASDRALDLCLHLSAEGEHITAAILAAFAASYRHLRV